MFVIRVLTGPLAGQILPLKVGKNSIGRAPTCDLKIPSPGVSKEHASILVIDDKLILTDLDSRNGTFINGVRIQSQRVEAGDKFALHDIIFDIVKVAPTAALASPHGGVPAVPSWAGSAAAQLPGYSVPHGPAPAYGAEAVGYTAAGGAHLDSSHPQRPMQAGSLADLVENFKIYIDNVAMPGIYALVQSMPYRWALTALVAVYIASVTALSVIPMMSVTKDAIRTESLRRAKTIARSLAAMNRQAIVDKNDLAVSTRVADIEEGVTASYILSARDGTVIAPSSKRGELVSKSFVSDAWRKDQESEAFIDNSNLGVSIPITYYSSELGGQSVAAYAVVLYDMGTLAMSSIQSLSLFIQTLALALIVGGLLLFFLVKIVEQPIVALNGSLDDALREGRDDLRTPFQFPQLEALISNINSALSRIGQPSSQAMPVADFANRDHEARNLVRMLPIAALTVNAIDDRIIASNSAFDQLVGGGLSLGSRPLSDIPDMALRDNLSDLLPRMRSSLGEIALSEIPFFGNKYEICGQAVMGTSEPAYFLITLSKHGEGD